MTDPRRITLTVNGVAREGHVEPRRLLVDFLREDLGLTGTHVGCEHGICGACTILVDGEAARSCLMLAVQADGAELMTVEGLARDGRLHAQGPVVPQRHHPRRKSSVLPHVSALGVVDLHLSFPPRTAEMRRNLCRSQQRRPGQLGQLPGIPHHDVGPRAVGGVEPEVVG